MPSLVVAGVLVLLTAGDKNGPTVRARKDLYWLSLVKTSGGSCRDERVALLSNSNTAAWNQALSTLHINGPPESLWTNGKDGCVLSASFFNEATENNALLFYYIIHSICYMDNTLLYLKGIV